MPLNIKFYTSLFLFWLSLPIMSWTQLQLPNLFTDHLVLQREIPIPVWGTADENAAIEMSLNQTKISTKADYFGNWTINLPAMQAGGPYQLIIQSNGEIIHLKDIYIGEVWLCAGQSNMEWPLKNAAKGAIEIPKAHHPKIRFFHLKKRHDTYRTPYTSEQLIDFTKGNFFHPTKWELCTPETAAEFSGVGYFFGKQLQDALPNVAIGLIQAAVGGSPAQSWVSKEALTSHPQMQSLLHIAGKQTWLDSEIIHPWLAERAKENWANWKKTENANLPGHPFAPSYLYDAAIRSIAPYPIRGAIWYQGESNATHPKSYPVLMELLLKDWRKLWAQGDFPFYFVQLPKIGNRSLWPEFRQAQAEGLSIPNTAMVVTIDEGHPSDVHPREKEVIGQRLANLALAKTYAKNILAESPSLFSYHWEKKAHQITLTFAPVYEGLKIKDGDLPKGIYLQGYLENGMIEAIIPPEKISITKDAIVINYPTNFLPVKVKYAWMPYPENNLVNSVGLPVAPFRIELEGNN